MKINFNIAKFVFIFLYLLLISAIILIPGFLKIKDISFYLMIFIFAVTLVLIFMPIKYTKIGYYKYKKSKIIPIIIFSLMLAILILSINFTLSEFFDGNYLKIFETILNTFYLYIVLLILWIIFAVIGIIINLKKDEDSIYKKYLITIISGSLLELIITIPLHILIIKRDECLIGLVSMYGIIGGFIVLMFIMGPSIFLFILYFYKKYNKNKVS